MTFQKDGQASNAEQASVPSTTETLQDLGFGPDDDDEVAG